MYPKTQKQQLPSQLPSPWCAGVRSHQSQGALRTRLQEDPEQGTRTHLGNLPLESCDTLEVVQSWRERGTRAAAEDQWLPQEAMRSHTREAQALTPWPSHRPGWRGFFLGDKLDGFFFLAAVSESDSSAFSRLWFFSASGQPERQWWAVNLPVTWPEPSQPGVGHFLGT